MITRFIGDVHGKVSMLIDMLNDMPKDVTSVIQVGDMGVGFGQSEHWHSRLDETLKSKNTRFIRGNHDDPNECEKMESWIQDGFIENNVMYVGGAWSIDRYLRIEGINWWANEEISYNEFQSIINVYNVVLPNVMVTHDCPRVVATKFFFEKGKPLYGKEQNGTRTGYALDSMFETHKPKLHVFGHWHYDVDEVIDGTRFICLNELSYVDVNMETYEVVRTNQFKY